MTPRLDRAQHPTEFRERLIELVIATRYARDPIKDENIDRIAKSIGLDPDLLLEARVRYRIQRRRDGFQIPMGRKRCGTRHYQIKCDMPEQVYRDWKHEAARRGVDSAALMRSIMHAYLLGSYEPGPLLRRWQYKGQDLTIPKKQWESTKGKGAYPYKERSLVTWGSMRALRLRAERLGHRPTAIMRALILEILDGKFPHVRLIDAQSMFDDETRYRIEPGAFRAPASVLG
jgi:hypothetical protein